MDRKITKIESNYLPSVDLLKFLLTIIIVIYHAVKFDTETAGTFFPRGYVAVEVFFIISGILMAKNVQKKGIENIDIGQETWLFLLRKVRGIIIPVYVAFIINFIIRHLILEQNWIKDVIDLTLSVREVSFTYLGGVNAGRFYNGPSWYISAMLLAMLILYPFLRKYFSLFSKIMAPLISLFGYAYINNNCENLNVAYHWLGFCMAGLLRAICGICLGIFCNAIIEELKKYNLKFNLIGKCGLILIQLLALGYIILIAMDWVYLKADYFDYYVPFLGSVICIILFLKYTEIEKEYYVSFCKNLSKFQLALFLNHRIWIYYIEAVFGEERDFYECFVFYIVATIITALFAMRITNMVEKHGKNIWKRGMDLITLNEEKQEEITEEKTWR